MLELESWSQEEVAMGAGYYLVPCWPQEPAQQCSTLISVESAIKVCQLTVGQWKHLTHIGFPSLQRPYRRQGCPAQKMLGTDLVLTPMVKRRCRKRRVRARILSWPLISCLHVYESLVHRKN